MTTKEAKTILKEKRPDRPRKTTGRKLQMAIDVAIATIDDYEKIIKTLNENGTETCEFCKHNFRLEKERPCSICKHNFENQFERKTSEEEAKHG